MHWFYEPTFSSESNQISSEELKHFSSLRIRPGEQVTLTDGRGTSYLCEVLDPNSGSIQILETHKHKAPETKIHLVQALAKGGRDEMALQMAIELGASSVTPWEASNSISNWRGKEEKSRERWQQIAISAMKQSQQAFLPVVAPLTFDPKPFGHGVLLDLEAEATISSIPEATEYTVVVGPEGGITSREREKLIDSGFTPYRIGPTVLRTSSAGPAAISALWTLRGTW